MLEIKKRLPRGKKTWIILGVVLFIILVVWVSHSGGPPGGGMAKNDVQAVGVATAIAGPMPERLDELGTVTPTDTITIVPQISGTLMEVGFTEGQMVQKGQFLAQIDPRPYLIDLQQDQATLAKDQASLAQARSDLLRYKKLARQNSISAQQVSDQVFTVAQDEAAVKADQANIATAQLNLSYCHITSPIAGRVGLRLIDPGNYVTSGSSLVVVTSISPTTVIFSVAQQNLAPVLEQIEEGKKLVATAYGSDDVTKLESGVLSAVDNQMNTSTGMVKLRADFANTDDKLFPNQFVNIHLLVKTLQNATLVPSPAVQQGNQGAYVYVVQPDGKVKIQDVTTGPTDGINTVITEGIKPGAEVVVDGVDRLTDGSPVRIVGRETVTTNGQPEQAVYTVTMGEGKRSKRRGPPQP